MAAFTASRGRVAAVSDEQILDAYRWLADSEGVFCEPASAASVAGLLAHGLPVVEGAAPPESVVCVLTGHGLKDPDTALGKAPAVINCDNDLSAVERAVFDDDRPPPTRPRPRLLGQPRARLRRDGGGGLAAPRAGGRGDRGVLLDPGGLEVSTGRDNLSSAPSRACTRPTGSPSGCAARSRWRAGSAPAPRRSSPASSPPTTSSSWRCPRRRCWRGRPSSRAIPTTSPRRSTAASSSAAPTRTGRRVAARFDPPEGLEGIVVIPPEEVSTKLAREAIPAEIPLADAVANVSAAALLVLGLRSADLDLVARGLADAHPPAAPPRPLPALDGDRRRGRRAGRAGGDDLRRRPDRPRLDHLAGRRQRRRGAGASAAPAGPRSAACPSAPSAPTSPSSERWTGWSRSAWSSWRSAACSAGRW